jgi:colanic acid biosynthesis glycosyl transferase WcaI
VTMLQLRPSSPTVPASADAGVTRICIADYAGHPFQVQLSREFARRGHPVLHLHFGQAQTPKGRLSVSDDDAPTLSIQAVELDEPFSKHNYLRRWMQERKLGKLFAGRIVAFRPDVVIAANMPLDVLDRIMQQARVRGIATVFWMQDVYSAALGSILRKEYGIIGSLIAAYYRHVEFPSA